MKKLIYFIPAVPFTVLFVYFAIGTSIEVTPIAWTITILLILSGMLMYKDKWWGCIFGIISSSILIYMGLQETGQIVKEYVEGVPMLIFYIVCGFVVAKHNKKK